MKKKLSKLELALKKIAVALQAYINEHINNTSNPHSVTKTQVGLGNVTNDSQVKRSEMGANNGVATLGTDGKVPSSQLPSYTLDDVLDGSNRKIPTKVSELTNDSGFLTGHQSLVDYATKTFVENKFKDAFGINASGVSDLAAILSDEDYTTGILNVIANKVDKVSGKGLSTNDYTTTEKNKLSGIESGAQVHIAPTAAEVKSALGTGSGTSKYLREDGTWVTPPDTNTWPTALSLLTNDTGYITGITSSMVIAALGYTPPSSDTNTVTSINGKTGEIAAADMAAVLTAAGYALTDTNTWPTALSQLSNDVGYITGITSNMVTTALGYTPVATDTNTWRPLGTGADDACAGNDSRLSDARPASDVYSWAKAANKPSYGYSEIGYTILTTSSAGGAITVDATKPLHEITVTAAVSSITFASNSLPENGHSCHLIITAASALSVTIAHNATMATVDSVAYKSVCPEASDVALDIVAGGYIELDLLRIGTKIYVRGI